MLRQWRLWLIGFVIALAGLWLWDRIGMIAWVGAKDLEISFIVSEAGSGQPVPFAKIDVNSRGGCSGEPDEQAFLLMTDSKGNARRMCRCMSAGRLSRLRLTDTYSVRLPGWTVSASAPGYRSSEWIEIDTTERVREWQPEEQRGGKLVVGITLQRSHD